VARTFDKLGNRCSDTAELVLDEVRVPGGYTIGEVGRGFQQQMRQFVTERMFAAYTTAGQCQYALDRTREFVHQRSVFGRPACRPSPTAPACACTRRRAPRTRS